MDKVIYLLPALICPVGMGLMMWFMMRGGRSRSSSSVPPGAPGVELLPEIDEERRSAAQR